MVGDHLKLSEEYTGTWRFEPKRKGRSINIDDIFREMFDLGLEGSIYGIIFKIPCEYPVEGQTAVDVLEPEQMLKILCQWTGWRIFDQDGEEIPLD